jgi:membrane fusion protein (multidrug efflux system)
VYVVPQTSVINNDQGKFVYVADANNQVAIKPIVTGNWVGENWVVMSGLNAGDKVITDNIIKLRPGSPVSPHAPGTAPGAPNGAAPANGKQPPAKPEATKTQTPANKA